MKKSNRILSFLLALVMIVSLLPGNVAFAEESEEVGRANQGVGPYAEDSGVRSDQGSAPYAEDSGARSDQGIAPYAGDGEVRSDQGIAPYGEDGDGDGGIIAPVTEPTPTPEEPEEPGDPDEPGEPEEPGEPVGDDAPGGPPVISPETGEDEEEAEAGEIQALPPENGAEPMSVPVSGVVYASELEENCELVLTEDTELRMDVAKVLRSISGDYALTINGSFTLTVNNPDGDAINVKTLTSSVSMKISSSRGYGIYANDSVTVTGAAMLQVTADDDAVRAGKGINISAGTVSLNAGWDGLYAGFTDGSLSVSANTLTIDAGSNAIEQNKGAVTVNINSTGTLTSRYSSTDVSGYGYGITAAGDVNLGGGGMLTVSSKKNCIIANGSVTASNLSLDLTSSSWYGIYAEDDVAITGVAMLQVTAHDDAVRAGKGINISAGTVNLNAGWDGLYAGFTDGSLSVSANTLTIDAGSNAIEQNKGAVTVNISGTGTLTSRYSDTGEYGYGITAAGDVNLGGGGMLTVSSQKHCMNANGSVTASNLSLDLTSSASYGIQAEDDVAITGAALLQVTAQYDAVHARRGINISADTVSLNAGSDGLYAGNTDGSLSVSANTLTIDAGFNAVQQRSGAVTVNVSGTGTLTSRYSGTGEYGYGITAVGDVNLGGGGMLTVSSQKHCMNANGSVTASNLSLDLTSSASYGIQAEDDVAITGVALLQVTAHYDAVHARRGIIISAGTVSLNAGWDGLYAGNTDGSLSVSANTLTIESGSNAIEQKKGAVTVNVSGTGTIISTYGGTISDNGYGIVAVGDISLSGGTLTVRSTRDCVHSGSSVTMENGLLLYARSTGFLSAIHASEGIYLGNTLTVCIPKGSSFRNGDHMIMDAWGTYAYDVVIGTPLTGTLSIEGGATEYAYGETISVISSGLPSATEYMWQVSEDGENWTDLEPGHGVYSDSVIRIQRTPGISLSGQYYRLVATCTGLFGEVISPEVYVKQAYKVRYYPNGGSGSMDNVGGWLSAGITFTLHQNTFTPPERKSFKAWRIDGVEYQPGDTITISGDTYIYAVWQQSEWLIQFSPGSGIGASGSMAPMTVPCGESFTLPACSFTPPEGKTFSRWWLGGNLYYAPGDRITPNSNEVVVAEWRSNRTVVGFDPNGGRGSMNPVSLTPEQALDWTVPECTYNPPEDHVFEKWEVIDRNNGDSYFALPGDEVSFTSYSITLKAIWMLKPSFEVSFNANGHGTAPLPQSVMQDHYAMDPGPLSAEGYTFLGWYTEAAGTNRFDFAATKITGPITLYAKWMKGIKNIEISGFRFPEVGLRSVPSAQITTGNKAYVCTGIQWRWPSNSSSSGYAASNLPISFAPSTEYWAVITVETVRDALFDPNALESVTINGETYGVDLTQSGFVSETKYQIFTAHVTTEDAIPIDVAHFPDAGFRSVLSKWYCDTNQDGYLVWSEIANITELDLIGKGIQSLEGVGNLSCLKILKVTNNNLTTLDLSSNWDLEEIYCSGNPNLADLTVPYYTNHLECYGCALTDLDLRNTKVLKLAAAETPTISANGQTATYEYYVNGILTAKLVVDASAALYDSYVNYARVRFDPGVGSGSMPSVMASKATAYTLPANGFTAPEDMYFNGWKLGGTDEAYAAGATMGRLFAADENEVVFVAQWKSKKVLSITPPDATKQTQSEGFPVAFTFSGEQQLSGSKWYSRYDTSTHTAGEMATSLIANQTYYGMILFPKGITAKILAQQIKEGTFVLRNAELVEIVSSGSGSSARAGLVVSVMPRTLTVTFFRGGGSGIMAPVTGRYPGSSYKLPASTFTAPADMVFDRWSLGEVGSTITLIEDIALIARWKVEDGAIPVTADFFPDEDFRTYVSETFDTNHGGYLIPSEIETAMSIGMDCFDDLESVEGIGYLTELRSLALTNDPGLTQIDLSANTKLTDADLGYCGLTDLDVSMLPALTLLWCNNNPLNALNLGEQPELHVLVCSGTGGKLTELDLTECPLLLDAVLNGVRTEAEDYVQYENGSNLLQVDADTMLITDKGIPVDEEHFPDGVFRGLVSLHFDLDSNGYLNPAEIEAITEIGGDFTGAAIADLRGVEYFTYLETLDVSGNELTELDLSANTALTSVNLRGNALFTLDLTGLAALEMLDCSRNPLPALELTGLTGLKRLYCVDNGLSSLDLSGAANLEYLSILGNPELSELDVRPAPKLLQAVREGTKEDYTDEGYDGWIYHLEPWYLLIDKGAELIGPLPVITEEPQDITVRITAWAVFTVAAEGENLTYQWQSSTDGGETWTDLAGETAETLRVIGTEENNGQQFRCIVTNRHGVSTVSRAATLTVNGGKCGENAYWTLEDGVLLIFGEGAMYDYSTGTAPWYALREQITTVVVEEEIARIGYYAFYNCVHVTGAAIPETVTAIGSGAFQNCSSLESVTIPASVTSIDSAAFQNCTALENLRISEGVESIGSSAFLSCVSLREILIPDSVTTLSIKAFQDCTSLENVTIGSGVSKIGTAAFRSCTALTAITIPETVRSIGSMAFSGCAALNEITFAGDAPLSISNNSFNQVTATAYYPVNNSSWTEDKFQNYGGTLTWKPFGPVTLSLNACGGTGTPETLIVNAGEAVGELPVPVREGWVFLGWFEAEAESTFAAGQGAQITDESIFSANATVYAHWRQKGDINGDGEMNNKDVTSLIRYIKYHDVTVVEESLDVNGDGEVSNKDVTWLIRYIKYGDVEIH